MKIIQKLSEKIEEEINDADSYIKLAMHYKDDYPELAKTFYTLSTQELEHMQMLHDQVTDLIRAYRAEKGEPPESMMAVYNYLHEKQIKHTNKVKARQDAYKNL